MKFHSGLCLVLKDYILLFIELLPLRKPKYGVLAEKSTENLQFLVGEDRCVYPLGEHIRLASTIFPGIVLDLNRKIS